MFYVFVKNNRAVVILNSWNVLENPDEISGQFEGDIVLTDIQAREIAGLNRNGRIDTYYRWKDNTVYYQITNDFDAAQKDYILKALQNISESAPNCIKFKQRTNEIDYVEVIVCVCAIHINFQKNFFTILK